MPEMTISLAELKDRVVNSAIHHMKSYTITSSCHADAATLVLIWAMKQESKDFSLEKIEAMTEEAYRHFEFDEPTPEWDVSVPRHA